MACQRTVTLLCVCVCVCVYIVISISLSLLSLGSMVRAKRMVVASNPTEFEYLEGSIPSEWDGKDSLLLYF